MRRASRLGLVVAAALALAGAIASCGGSLKDARGPAHGPPEAQPARPIAKKKGAIQDGYASWYGNQFHGRKTASGERFDQNALTAAHRTLPFGTKVRVTNRKNGRQVVLRINDRGPFGSKKRVIDVSKRAARDLDMIRAGVVPVRVEVLWTP